MTKEGLKGERTVSGPVFFLSFNAIIFHISGWLIQGSNRRKKMTLNSK